MHLANASRFIRDGDLRNAETELRRAVDLVPDNPAYLARLGQVLGMQNRMQEAGRYYSRALKLAPDSVAIRRNLALTQWSRRLFSEAKARRERCSGPGFPPGGWRWGIATMMGTWMWSLSG